MSATLTASETVAALTERFLSSVSDDANTFYGALENADMDYERGTTEHAELTLAALDGTLDVRAIVPNAWF
jgi:hypothetical protein